MRDFENRLKGGHPNSLGNTVEIVEEVLAEPGLFDELFNCWFSEDELVRLRVSNGVKRVCKAQKDLLVPYLEKLLTEIAAIDQASTQWTLATLFDLLSKDLSAEQRQRATIIMQHNLAHHQDWIVLNNSMDVLWKWSKKDPELRPWLRPHIERLAQDSRKSVAKRAGKILGQLEG